MAICIPICLYIVIWLYVHPYGYVDTHMAIYTHVARYIHRWPCIPIWLLTPYGMYTHMDIYIYSHMLNIPPGNKDIMGATCPHREFVFLTGFPFRYRLADAIALAQGLVIRPGKRSSSV